MFCRNQLGKWAVIFIIAVLAWGCAISLVDRKVALFYEGPQPRTLLASASTSISEILISPTVDLRTEKDSYGAYDWGNSRVNFISSPGTVAEAVSRLISGFFQKAGVKTVTGRWNGQLDTLQDIPAAHAIYSEIERLDFSGKGRFYKANNRGIVRLTIKWGNKAARKVVSRTVEVTPDLQQFHILDTAYDHVARMESVIRDSVNRAVWEGMSTLFQNKR